MTGEDLGTWLLKQADMDLQSAQAVPNEIGNIKSRWSPARLIARSEAIRRIIAAARAYSPELEHGDNGEWALDLVLRLLAEPYDDKPGYREEWRP